MSAEGPAFALACSRAKPFSFHRLCLIGMPVYDSRMPSNEILFPKKVKLAVSLVAVAVLYATVIALLTHWKEDLAVLSALLGTALGWFLGTMLSPFKEGEIRTFKVSVRS
jgi:hypothetical protein